MAKRLKMALHKTKIVKMLANISDCKIKLNAMCHSSIARACSCGRWGWGGGEREWGEDWQFQVLMRRRSNCNKQALLEEKVNIATTPLQWAYAQPMCQKFHSRYTYNGNAYKHTPTDMYRDIHKSTICSILKMEKKVILTSRMDQYILE